MTVFRQFQLTLLAGSGLLPLASAHAYTPRIFYQGSATATDAGPPMAPSQSFGGTTSAPASYQAVSGANSARSTSDASSGGSVYSTAAGTSSIRSDGYLWSGGSGAQATIAYYAALTSSVAPGGYQPPIPVRLQASGYVDGVPSAEATARFNITYNYGGSSSQSVSDYAQIRYDGTGRRSFAIDQIIDILPDTEIAVLLSAYTGAHGPLDAAGSSWSTAFVDPIFTIDPAYAADYHFIGIPGVSAVPEPGSIALLLAGLTTIAAQRRRATNSRAGAVAAAST